MGINLKRKCIKILIPTHEPGGLDAQIYPHWKDAPVLTIVSLCDSDVTDVETVKLASDELIVNVIREKCIKYVITQSLSTRALELLNRLGVGVLLCTSKTVKEAIEKFLKKELYLVTLTKTKLK